MLKICETVAQRDCMSAKNKLSTLTMQYARIPIPSLHFAAIFSRYY
jgi:hypothetical protein